MITIFNRAELIMTYNMDEQYRIRNILADHNIDYTIKIHSPTSTGGHRRNSTIMLNTDYMYEYRIFVHKKDLEYALHLIHNKR